MHGGCAGAIHLCVGLNQLSGCHYLALDYMLHEPRIRPLAHRRQWADGVDRPWPFQPTMVELSRSFQCILKAYWKSNRVSICSEVTRSVVPGCDCWLMCAQVA